MERNKFLYWSTRTSAIIWIASILAFIVFLGLSTKWFKGTVQDTQLGNSKMFLVLFLAIIGLGVLAFGIMILSIIVSSLLEKKIIKFEKSFKGISVFPFKLFLFLVFLPLFLLYNVIGVKDFFEKVKKKGFKLSLFKPTNAREFVHKLVGIVAISITLLPLWVGGYFVLGVLTMQVLGFNPEPITVSGTGSMYPTFAKGQGKTPEELSKEIVGTPGMLPYPNGLVIAGNRLFGHQISREDIVVLINDKTKELSQKLYGNPSGWVKRVIGLPGDTIELRDGIVYLNDQPLKEPYTAKARSTFGEAFLGECKKVTIPEDSVFVMGDNRKGSGDSREIGFIKINDINHVLPLKNQIGTLDKNWRDTSKDLEESSKIKIDKQKYIELLNEKRKEAKVGPLKYQSKLDNSALRRGEVILKYDDFSFEATRSGYTMVRAMSDSGYSNIVYGEAPSQGYYEAEELLENQFEYPKSKEFLLDKDYQEIGISEVEGELNGCPTQIIVQHFAGYIPPNYKKEDVEGWKTSLSKLREIQSGWAGLKDSSRYETEKQDVDRINDIINTRIANMEAIVIKMESNRWLNKQEVDFTYKDKSLYEEQESLANKLNSK